MGNHENISSLGELAAEDDRARENWENIFLESAFWEKVRDGRTSVLLGRKGTGKTAVRYALGNLAAKNERVLTADLSFRDYPWGLHHQVQNTAVGSRYRFRETWTFAMLVEVAKLLVGSSYDDNSPGMRRLREYLTSEWRSVDFDHTLIFAPDRFLAPRSPTSRGVRSVFQPSSRGQEINVLWETVPRPLLGDSLSVVIDVLRDWILLAIADVKPESIYVVLDELDLDFDDSDEDYLDSMVGLLVAGHEMRRWATDNKLPVHPVILMREDIYEALQYPEKNKFRNWVERINWSPGEDSRTGLKKLIERRIVDELGDGHDDPWGTLFDSKARIMRRQRAYSFIVSRTFNRPRDLIQFTNYALSQRHLRLELGADRKRQVSGDDVRNARQEYSAYLHDELMNEFSGHAGVEGALNAIRRLGYNVFEIDTFEEAMKETDAFSRDGAHGALKKLYQFGVVALGSQSGRVKDDTFSYSSKARRDFDVHVPFFRVHPGLKEFLVLTDRKAPTPR